jgi:beta-galactosidase/beta-glucuronidase
MIYPRPQLRRSSFHSLDGIWELAIDHRGNLCRPSEVTFDRTIRVPFAPETARSGLSCTDMFRACWYRRRIRVPAVFDDQRVLLHFEAVDWDATVWLDGARLGSHQGGYTPFQMDVTEWADGEEHELVVRCQDDPMDLEQPRGKQDWKPQPHSIWYPRTSGIWQTVWMEVVPAVRIGTLSWTARLDRWELDLQAHMHGERRDGLVLAVRLSARGRVLAQDRYSVINTEVTRSICAADPGIDDSRNELLWSPERPTLIHAELQLVDDEGKVVDEVQSYTALRSVAVDGDRFLLNGRPYPLLMVLDQGYWPETGLTAPDDAALRRDVLLAKEMGFNGVRKHQKIESPRYLYWADQLGLLVWEEMPSAYRFTRRSVERLTAQWTEVIARDRSHPCIVAWVPFNESWGIPNLPDSPAERDYVQAIYHLTKTLDPTRPVIANDGWENVSTDIVGIHDYDSDPEQLERRYTDGTGDAGSPRLRRQRAAGRRVYLPEFRDPERDHPVVLSEFGGMALAQETESTWGYSRCADAEELAQRYEALLEVVRCIEMLSGFCYTQFADTYQEANGLLYADRSPKFPLERIARATRGRGRSDDSIAQQSLEGPRRQGFMTDHEELAPDDAP